MARGPGSQLATDTMAEPAFDPEAELIGSSPALVALRAAILPAAMADTPLFLAGESGTGKDCVAQMIHAASPRAGAGFVTLNGSALPDDILDREIYGNAGPGVPMPYPSIPRYLAQAQGGTLYVDDICRTSGVLQARLLHLIRTGRIIDESGAERHFTARIIAATNTDLGECLRGSRLRRDLYDMLSAGLIELPPLRARGTDAAQIAAKVFPELQRRLGLPQVPLAAATLARINSLPWPGNVRQLLNVLRRMALAPAVPGSNGPDLPADVLADIGHADVSAAPRHKPVSFADLERRAILDAIARHGGSVQKAADELQVAASTIYRKLKGWQGG